MGIFSSICEIISSGLSAIGHAICSVVHSMTKHRVTLLIQCLWNRLRFRINPPGTPLNLADIAIRYRK